MESTKEVLNTIRINKYNETIKKESLVLGLKYNVYKMRIAKTKYGDKLIVVIHHNNKLCDLFIPQRYNSIANELVLKKNLVLQPILRVNKNSEQYVDLELFTSI